MISGLIIIFVIWEIFATLINWAATPSKRELEQRRKELNAYYLQA